MTNTQLKNIEFLEKLCRNFLERQGLSKEEIQDWKENYFSILKPLF